MSELNSLISGAFKEASERGVVANINRELPQGVVPFPARIGTKERRALASIILFKASTLKTTEEWVKESAEAYLKVNELYAIKVSRYEEAVNFLMEFNDENYCFGLG